jgi:hypothetical protein
MNGKFVEKYGTAWKEMNTDMKLMAIMSELFDFNEEIKPIVREWPETCKQVAKNKYDLSIAKWAGGVVVSAIIVALIAFFFELLKGA